MLDQITHMPKHPPSLTRSLQTSTLDRNGANELTANPSSVTDPSLNPPEQPSRAHMPHLVCHITLFGQGCKPVEPPVATCTDILQGREEASGRAFGLQADW